MDTQALETIDLSQRLGELLLDKGLLISTAESCTAGGIASAIASIDGSSSWFVGGIISYSTALKQSLLGVSAGTLSKYGVVSEETVIEMNIGALARTGSDCAISISGYAGASGGDEFVPNGTVWICFSIKGQTPVTKKIDVSGKRTCNLKVAVREALALAVDSLS